MEYGHRSGTMVSAVMSTEVDGEGKRYPKCELDRGVQPARRAPLLASGFYMGLILICGWGCGKEDRLREARVEVRIESVNPESGVRISIDPPDINGVSDGLTPLRLVYGFGDIVVLTAAPSSVGGSFNRWELGAPETRTDREISIEILGDTTLRAFYGDVPKACFTSDGRCGFGPLDVTFDAGCSWGDELHYLWDFGDGTQDTTKEPTHHFEVGEYDVLLVVENAVGRDERTEDVVLVTPLREPTISTQSVLSTAPGARWRFYWSEVEGADRYDYTLEDFSYDEVTHRFCNVLLHGGSTRDLSFLYTYESYQECYRTGVGDCCQAGRSDGGVFVRVTPFKLVCGEAFEGPSACLCLTSRLTTTK